MSQSVSKAQLAALFAWWKNDFLPLRDWTIRYDFRRYSELDGDHGRVDVVEVKRQAFIRLLEPNDALGDEMEPYDMEVALVHELLHCALAPFMRSDISEHQDVVQEQSVHAMSVSLVRNRRLMGFGPVAKAARARVSKLSVVSAGQKAA